MKTLIVTLALVAVAFAFEVEDIPPHMKDRLDRYVTLKKQWAVKWTSMSEEEQKNYEQVLLARLEHLPEIEHRRIHERVQFMPEEHRHKLRDYLRRRFPQETRPEQLENEVEEIDEIVQSLPDAIRERISSVIRVRFQEATAYSMLEETDEVSGSVKVYQILILSDLSGN